MIIGGPMIPRGAIVGGGEVSSVLEEGVGRAGPGRVGDGVGEGSWEPLPLPLSLSLPLPAG